MPSGWSFYSPGSSHATFGRLPWWLEGQEALIPDPDVSRFEKTPLCPAEGSLNRRTATLRLAQDGSLEGDVRIESWGHEAWRAKEDYGEASEARRAEKLRDGVRARIPDAEITKVAFEHITDDTLPCAVSFHVRVPDYAQRTGSRVFLEPDFFGRGRPSHFSAKSRRFPIAFAYASASEDSVTFILPDSMGMEAGPSSEPLVARGIGRHRAQVLLAADGRSLCYRSTSRLGEDGSLLIPRADYARVKDFFDRVQAAADQTVLLRPREAPP